jgi:hypothetical protein
MTELSPAAQTVLHAYGNCIGGVDAMMGSERRGLVAALRAAAAHCLPQTIRDRRWIRVEDILAIAAELENYAS